MKMTWRLCAALVAVAAGLCLSSCGSDDDNDDSGEVVTPPTGSGGSTGGSGTGGSTKLNLVGKTYEYYYVGKDPRGYNWSYDITLKFTTSTQCLVKKSGSYYKYKGHEQYGEVNYEVSKTTSYKVTGNRVTVNGAWPFNSYFNSESLDDMEWTLDYDPQWPKILTSGDADGNGEFV